MDESVPGLHRVQSEEGGSYSWRGRDAVAPRPVPSNAHHRRLDDHHGPRCYARVLAAVSQGLGLLAGRVGAVTLLGVDIPGSPVMRFFYNDDAVDNLNVVVDRVSWAEVVLCVSNGVYSALPGRDAGNWSSAVADTFDLFFERQEAK